MTQPKYIKNRNGVHAYNPAWRPEEEPEIQLPPAPNKSTALPVVSAPYENDGGKYFPEDEEIVIAPSYQQAVKTYTQVAQDAEIVVAGTDSSAALADLNRMFSKYEVPAGMLSKLLLLQDFDIGEIIVDDSGSMAIQTDAKGPHGETISRWVEAKYNVIRMMEVLAYVPNAPPYFVRFLNQPLVLELERQPHEAPDAFVTRATHDLEQAFASRGPNGTTPARERIQESLQRQYPQSSRQPPRVLRYFLGDGVPNGGPPACRQIEQMLRNRPNPQDNPFTFISCTNQDDQVEWMKECEEVAPFCAEYDDFSDESREILKDQGRAFPYSFGLHLVGQIVGAACPHDLDAMDESVPFTKQTLDSILGYQSAAEEYKYYFDSFLDAQRQLYQYAGNALQKNFALRQLPTLYPQFVSASLAVDVPIVQQYKADIKRQQQSTAAAGYSPYGGGASRGGPAQDECCVVL